MNSIVKFLIIATFGLVLIHCSKKPVSKTSAPRTDSIVTKLEDTSKVEIQVSNIEFEYLQAKGKLAYQDANNSTNAHFNLRIKKDSLIWISVSQLGIEGARFMITKDSIFGINRLNKESYIYSIAYFQELFNVEVNFNTFQSILLGNMPFNTERGDKLIQEGKYSILERNKESYDLEAYINIESLKLEKMVIVQKPLANTLNINYTDFKPLLNFIFPYKTGISLKYINEGKLVYNSIYLEYNKVELDEKELKFPFKIPRRFNEP